MKIITCLLIMFISLSSLGNVVKVELNPAKPVVGEVFQAFFRVFTEAEEMPVVNFSPNNLEVVGKSNQGVSTRTIYANGKLTVTREVTLVYDLVSSKPGPASLRDISIQIEGKTIRHSNVLLSVLKEAEELAEVFVMADVPKKELFLGEGLIIRYYLYSKVPISNLDIKKYPKLNNFLKRYLQEPERTERVSVDGQLYMRTQIYAAKLFPEKVGNLKIDSLNISATFPSGRSNDPFGAFGMSRDFKTRSITSEQISILVKPLPAPVPTHFTGLVGKHEFDLNFGKNKLIVNEPLEIKLTVSGSGALENLETPALISNPNFEEFETNGDLKITDSSHAIKVFDYTFLAKSNVKIPAKNVTLSYFDPDSLKYVETDLKIPEIEIAGGSAKSPIKQPEASQTEKSPKSPSPLPSLKEFSSPLTVEEWEWKQWLPMVNVGLIVIIATLFLGWFLRGKSFNLLDRKSAIPQAFSQGRFDLTEFMRWIGPLISTTGKSPRAIIKESTLDQETKTYFINLLNANDLKDYSMRKSGMEFKYQKKMFKEMAKYIESVTHADHS